jgi:hypothetical protein
MRTLFLLLAFTLPATAQMPMPTTINLIDNKTGEKVGTATITPGDNKFYFRDNKGEFIGTIVVEKDGRRTFYDPHGKPTEHPGNITVPEVK